MRMRGATGLAAAVLAFAAGTAWGAEAANRPGFSGAAAPALAALESTFPGVRTHIEGQNLRYVYGMPMTRGATPDAAAEAFLAQYASVLGLDAADMELTRAHEISNGRFTVFAYTQKFDGLSVENSPARVLVNNELGRVVLASARATERPAVAFGAPLIGSEAAVAIAGAVPMYSTYGGWTIPELVVWSDENGKHAAQAWKFAGGMDLPGNFQWRTFFVDAATGALLESRDEVHTADVSGNVQGFGSPGVRAHSASNPPANLLMPRIRMTITGGSNAFTDMSGNYTIANPGTTPVTVTSNLSAGQWVNVNPIGVTELSVSSSVTPPGPGNFIFNNGSSTEGNVAQVNAFIHTTLTHNYIKDRAPTFNGLDIVIPANTGTAGTCNAFFTTSGGPSINFYNSGGGCNNTSFSTVIAHEYGHFIVNQLGLSQGSFGEGFGDTMAVMMYDVGIVGQDFTTGGGFVRNVSDGTPDYPCADEIHTCGEVEAGVWYFLKENFKSFYGTGPGLDQARQLNVDWAMATTGGSGNNAVHTGTLQEVLTLDDDNGDLSDGTPNATRICSAFSQHNIVCEPMSFVYPAGRPTDLTPGEVTEFPVNVGPLGSTPTPGTGRIVYSINGGTLVNVLMTQTSANHYTASIPAVNCGDTVSYYILAQGSPSNGFSPAGAPTARFSALGSYGNTSTTFQDSMEANLGWTAGMAGDNATTGIWTRVNPVGTDAQPEDDHTANPGVTCWVTGQGAVGGGLGDNDVDGGTTTLLSPVLNLAGASGARVSYWRWYSNTTGAEPNADTFVVQITNNGTTWVTAETVGPAGDETSGGWIFHEFNVGDFVAPTANVRVRFRAADLAGGSLIEAGVDDFKVTVLDCTPPCAADVNGGGLDVTDFLDFIDSFGECEGLPGPCAGSSGVNADFNGDTTVDVLDFLDFIDAFGIGCGD